MGLNENITALAQRVATEFKTLRGQLVTDLGGKADTLHTHAVGDIATSAGTKDSTTYLRGDGTWATPALTAHKSTHATGGTDALTPADIGAAVASHSHTATGISDSTATGRSLLTATDAAAARTAIGAGTSSLVIGTTSSTAKAGDYAPPADAVAGTASLRTLGTGAQQAAAGNHTHTAAAVGAAAATHTHPIADLTATGTKDSTTYLRGDGTWSALPAAPPPPSGLSTARPTNVTPGTYYFETDTKWTVQWDGAAWRYISLATDTSWQYPTFLNGWANYTTGTDQSFRQARYRKDSLGYVHIEGLIALGTVGQAAFQLGPAYRPSGGITSAQDAGQAHGRADVEMNTGNVIVRVGSNSFVSLNFHIYVG